MSDREDPIKRAETAANDGHFEEALEIYQKHINDRLEVSNRPDWENPYFYLLSMGDIYLRQDQPLKALEAFNQAERQGVEPSLVADRYRAVAHWYLDHRDLEGAMEVLQTYRDRDSLLFDSLLDQVARQLTAQESTHKQKVSPRLNTTSSKPN